MAHDVYICYDEKDTEISEAIYHSLKENNVEAWIKSKDMSSDEGVDRIVNVIEDCGCFLLVLSKHSKDAQHVIIEVDLAFSKEIPIIVFNVDNTKVEGNLEFILENQKILPSFSSPKMQLKNLIEETSKAAGKQVGKVRIDSKYLNVFEKANPRKTENSIKKYVKIVVPICIALILIYLFVIVPTGQHTTDNGVFSMNVTGVDVNGVTYAVHGEAFNMPSDAGNYFMNLKFFDKNENVVYEVNSTADEFKSGIIWQGDLHSDNVTHIGFRLTDINGKLISNEDYAVK